MALKREVHTPREQDAAVLALCRKYSWYIDHAFDFRRQHIEKQLIGARKVIAEEEPTGHVRDTQARESLQNMIDHLEWVQREFDEAHEALRAAGIK